MKKSRFIIFIFTLDLFEMFLFSYLGRSTRQCVSVSECQQKKKIIIRLSSQTSVRQIFQ